VHLIVSIAAVRYVPAGQATYSTNNIVTGESHLLLRLFVPVVADSQGLQMAVKQQVDNVLDRLHQVNGLPRLSLTCVNLCNSSCAAQDNLTAALCSAPAKKPFSSQAISSADDQMYVRQPALSITTRNLFLVQHH
jgi:5-deoxy-D-glucuronate isomerase